MVKINPKYPPKKPLKYFLEDKSYALFAPDFEKLGYIGIQLNSTEWNTVHHWCNQNFGQGNYTWTGSTFWFDRKDYAIEFALRWG